MTHEEEEQELEARLERLLAAPEMLDGSQVAAFLGAQFDLGLAWVHLPPGEGGLGVRASLQRTVDKALRAAGAPSAKALNPIGHGMAAPTIMAHGTPEQRRRFLRPLFTGEEVWCQLFSEPGAGSDLASVATRAVRDGDVWIVNGQKVWTTLAHLSSWGILVARTDPSLPKHKGLTYFVCDMRASGVEVRPLRQMTGDAEFNEVYLTDVVVPDSQRLGDLGDGWRVALTTLMSERVSLGNDSPSRAPRPIEVALDLARRGVRPAERDRVARLWVESEVLRLTNARADEQRLRGVPGPEGSVAKLMSAELNKRIYELCIDLLGAGGMLHESYEMRRPTLEEPFSVSHAFLRSRANSIEGGTSEILRNVLGERMLGLPSEPKVDRDVPWASLPR